MSNENEFMDLDGPEFINEVNHQIAAIRTNVAAVQNLGPSPSEVHGDLRAYYEYYLYGLQDLQTVPEPSSQIAVLDTNFLISNLGYLRDLSQKAAKAFNKVVLVIPWVVVKELDGLKNANKEQRQKNERIGNLGDLARTAMRFIEKGLREKAPWLRGQKSNEIHDPNAKHTKGDDSILDCCLFFHNTLHKPVTLLTNDRNLAIKAMVHDIQTLSSENKIQLADYLQSISKSGQTRIVDAQMEVDDMPIYDEDVDMLDASQQQQNGASQPDIQAKVSDIWKSRHAPGNGPINYMPPRQGRSAHSRRSDDTVQVLDKYGEVLKPPSSSEGRTAEQQKRKQNQPNRRAQPAAYNANTIYASAHAPGECLRQ